MRAKDLIESKASGDCFVVAGRNMIDNDNLELVHALVYGQGPLKGRRFPHAWNEIIGSDVVLDYSNGKKVVMRKEQYYELGGVEPNNPDAYAKYNKTEALKNMLIQKHWGPWDLDDSLEK